MFAHFIHYKRKGILVLLLPLLFAGILFTAADKLSWNDKFVPAIAFLISGIILFFIDNKRQKVRDGVIVVRTIKLPREKGKNTFMWIEMRYWGIFIGLIGVIWLINVI